MHNVFLAVFASAAVLALLTLIFRTFRKSRRARRHRKYIRKSVELVKMFRSWGTGAEARIFGYLRKVNPMVFEELVLTCLENAGVVVKRNRRYTGDGGVDGIFYLDDVCWLVQAKRYSSAINPAHVRAFVKKCNGRPGMFIHTGRTGSKSYSYLEQNVVLVSGNRLITFILGSPLEVLRR